MDRTLHTIQVNNQQQEQKQQKLVVKNTYSDNYSNTINNHFNSCSGHLCNISNKNNNNNNVSIQNLTKKSISGTSNEIQLFLQVKKNIFIIQKTFIC